MNNFLKKIKINLCKYQIANKYITNRSIKVHIKKINKIEKYFENRLKFYSPKDFKDLFHINMILAIFGDLEVQLKLQKKFWRVEKIILILDLDSLAC